MFRMDEDRARFVDTVCKILAVAGIAIGAAWTLYTYFNAKERDARTAAIEARRPFEAERLELYVEAASSAATIAASQDANEVAKAKDRFWTLYWGSLALVEDKAVESSMVELGWCIKDKKCDEPIEQLALRLAHACRDSIAEGWDIKLPKSDITLFRMERLRN